MINTNVTCDVLLGFVRGAFFKEIDDICKQRSVKISIEIEGVKKQREGLPTDGNEPSTPTSEHQELKEIQASGQLDVIDDTGARMKINDHLRVRAMELLKPRQVYQLVKLSDVPEAPPTALKFTMSV
ncbi:unnamed protein product [Aphanomyces euteiches]